MSENERPMTRDELIAEIERLRGALDEARAAAQWLRIVLTNMTQGEQMMGVYERWPWLRGDADASN